MHFNTNSAVIKLAPLEYRAALVDTLDAFKITNPVEFLATVYYESTYLANLVENLNYTCDALLKKFGRHRISYADAMRYGRAPGQPANQKAIANCIYGGKWGRENLGNTHTDDGWWYRGQGPIQLTGRDNWYRFGAFIGRQDVQDNPFYILKDPVLACQTSGWFWSEYKKLNKCGNDMRAITKLVTGASDTAIKTRIAYQARVQQLISHA